MANAYVGGCAVMSNKAHYETAWMGQIKDERSQSASAVKDLLFTSSIGLCVRVLFCFIA